VAKLKIFYGHTARGDRALRVIAPSQKRAMDLLRSVGQPWTAHTFPQFWSIGMIPTGKDVALFGAEGVWQESERHVWTKLERRT
jgi:hypothetical protein